MQTYKQRQREYNKARAHALRMLAQRHRKEYEQLVEDYLGRGLSREHQASIQQRWGKP